MTTTPMIETEALSRDFGGLKALDSVHLRLERGQVLGLLGHNGAGKTTLVQLLTTVLPPTSGSARVGGFDIVRDAREVRRLIGLTGQYASVDEQLSGRDNLRLIARLLGASRTEARSRADELLHLFDLTGAARRLCKTYSGGMRRRLDLAASLVGSPVLLFLDEPTTGLDPVSRASLWNLVQERVDEGTTVLLTTQYLEEADRLADRITVLSGGKVMAAGTAAQLKSEVGTRTVRLTVASAEQVERAAQSLRESGRTPLIDRANRTISSPVERSADLVGIVQAVDGPAVEITDIVIDEPTLDDVYLAFTTSSALPSASSSL